MSTVISIENLSKAYQLGAIGTGTLANDMKVWWAKLRGEPNPLQKIGEQDHGNRDGETIWALKDISITVQQGEVLGIIGRNGAGKSTLLKILSQVTAPTSGIIKVKGRIASLLEVGTGFHAELTGRENIYLNGAILGMSRNEISRKLNEIVDFSGVEKYIDTPVKRYSSGMYVRLAFAVAAHLEPEILVVDEVLAVGDAEFQRKCLGKMSEVASEGRTVLFVSHNMASIVALCQRGIVLEKGQMVFDGDASAATQRYFTQLQQHSHLSLSERQDRKGSGRCRFTKLTFEGTDAKPLKTLHSGQDIRIVLDYESQESVLSGAAKAVIEIHHSMYGRLIYCGSRNSGDLDSRIPACGRLVCTIYKLPLMPGSYSIDVFLKLGRELVDWIGGAAVFQVEEGDFYHSGKLPPKGIFLADYSWNIGEYNG